MVAMKETVQYIKPGVYNILPIDITALNTIASQELLVLQDKLKLELDTLIALHRFDTKAIEHLNTTQDAWNKYVETELKSVEHSWVGNLMCQLKVNAKHQDLIITRIRELGGKIEIKREAALDEQVPLPKK